MSSKLIQQSQNNRQLRFLHPTKSRTDLPLFIYLPGMDGTGELFHRQVPKLSKSFDIRCLSIPPEDRSDWEDLTDKTLSLIEQERTQHPHRPLYLCGESFGGCLALQVALKASERLEHLILINPASSFRQRPWVRWGAGLTQYLPQPFYQLSVFGLLPFLASLGRIEQTDRQMLFNAMNSVPQETSAWRMELLRRFDVNENQLKQIKLPTLLIAGQADLLLPSVAEAEHLAKKLPLAEMLVLADSGHACLLEKKMDLHDILKVYPTSLPQPALAC
ncbi:MAG: alpha/beta hydrolase [Microcoleaceae cyanobacterium]